MYGKSFILDNDITTLDDTYKFFVRFKWFIIFHRRKKTPFRYTVRGFLPVISTTTISVYLILPFYSKPVKKI